jgi:hypothetical protein
MWVQLLAFLGLAALVSASCGDCNTRYAFCCTSSDSGGWGWEKVDRMTSCIFPGSQAARDKCFDNFKQVTGGQRCGDYPVCQNGMDDGDGYGWELVSWDSCVVRGSQAAADQRCISSGGPNPPNPSGPNPNPSSAGCPPSLSGCPCGWSCGCEVVPGLGKRKQQILKAKSGTAFLASAMMETKKMSVSEYPAGDEYPGGKPKTGGAYCAGLAKQNWYMVRLCGEKSWKKLPEGGYKRMKRLNKSLSFDIKMYKNCRKRMGASKFFFGHRWGWEGIHTPGKHKKDVQCFIKGYQWTLKKLKGANLRNDYRFWVKIGPV